MALLRTCAAALVLCLHALGLFPAEESAELSDGVQLLQVIAAGTNGSQDSAILGSFVDNMGAVCVEGAVRVAEGALATKKASPLGRLYNQTFLWPRMTCRERGYTSPGDEDRCFPAVSAFYKVPAGKEAFAELERRALQAYQTAYSVEADRAELMVACTCHPKSSRRVQNAEKCATLGTVGSWVHQNPTSGKQLVCDEGPFEYSARVLSTLKSSPLMPMHLHDQIAPIPCAKRGFPMLYGATDHCYPQIHMWTRTEQPMHNCPPGGLGPMNPDCDDWGVFEAGEVEKALVKGDGFKAFSKKHGLTAVLDYYPACNCHADSMVILFTKKQQGPDVCARVETHSPVRDFWTG